MVKPVGLCRSRGGRTYRYRRRIPADLKPIYKKREINEPIGSERLISYKQACQIAHELNAKYEKEFIQKRHNLTAQFLDEDQLSSMSAHEIKALADKWLRRQLDTLSEERVFNQTGPLETSEVIQDLEMDLADIHEEIIGEKRGEPHRGMTAAIQYLKVNRISFQIETQALRRLAYYFSQAIKDLIQDNLDFYKGRRQKIAAIYQNPAIPNLQSIKLGDLIDKFMNDPSTHRGASTQKNYVIIFRALKEILGESKDVSEITTQDCEDVRDVLLEIPSNAAKRAPNVSLKRAAELCDKNAWSKLSPTTVNGYMDKLSSLMNYAIRKRYIAYNPAQKLHVYDPTRKKNKRNAFSTEQLQLIFGGLKTKKFKGHEYWSPYIALFTGMRMSEILQLEVTDFEEKEKVWCIHIRPSEEEDDENLFEKRVKTEAGIRFIPVHPKLKELGLINFVKKQEANKEKRMFPEVKPGNLGYLSDNYTKRFSNFLNSIGAKTPKTSFHSFRHCFRDALSEAEIPRDAILALGGWSSQSTADDYGSSMKASTLYRHICKIAYEDLQF